MNNIYYYTDINFIPPGTIATNGIFSCAENSENLLRLQQSGRYDIVVIGTSPITGDWTTTLTGYNRPISPSTVYTDQEVSGVAGTVGEDELVLASRLWMSHSTNHKRMNSDLMHKLVSMRIYASEDSVGSILLGPVFDWTEATDADRFLVQIKVNKPDWERLYLGMTNAEIANYTLKNKVNKIVVAPTTVLLYSTSGADEYFNTMRKIIRSYTDDGHVVESTVREEWCPFPLPDYETDKFRQYMAKWMLCFVNVPDRYKDGLVGLSYRGVDHESDIHPGGA